MQARKSKYTAASLGTPSVKLRWVKRGRRAMTIIEMMVVISLAAVLMGVVISFLHSLMQRDQRTRSGSLRIERLAALSDVLRADIRRGSDVSVADDGALVIESDGGELAQYTLDAKGCERRGAAVDGDKRPTEQFAMGPCTAWKLDRDTSGRRPLVTVTLERMTGNDRSLPIDSWEVQAALGADADLDAASPSESEVQ